jgi:CRP-like cAMP-binding protein
LKEKRKWLVQVEKGFRGTLDFAYALLLLCKEATLLRYSSDHFAINWYRSGFSIIEQGEQANSLYLILSGTADVIREAADGTLQYRARLEPGDFFGEEGLAHKKPACLPLSISSIVFKERVNMILGLKFIEQLQ